MSPNARRALVFAAVLLGVGGLACPSPQPPEPPPPDQEKPELKVHPRDSGTLVCHGFELRIPALDESMTPAWASFQIAQLNQEALAPLAPDARKALFEACVIPAIQGEK
ncbi:hypothetical protein JQX13_05655 [Archangium violaceum]|uniref:hypothetical protein n=1 Tax=Archangium violaceum TaxID=83451 RepID=UPI00193B6024|nr:hypothetical protein [Archangium violaceum]QRK09618.1 hypothetical protein JQX13_05655 [Archangium violaceum]